MTATATPEETVWIRAEIPKSTHKALRAKQNKIEKDTDKRPDMMEVAAQALNEWAALQQAG
jgi:hypothetical protein